MSQATDYWIQEAQQGRVDPDQVASQNYMLPPQVHQVLRNSQVAYLEEVLRLTSGPMHVLDLGCGPGTWALNLAHQVDSWQGYDVAPKFVEEARRQACERGLRHLRFDVGSILNLELGQRFNFVVLGGLLGYLRDVELLPLMRKVASCLEPGGSVYVRVSVSPGIFPRINLRRSYPISYRKVSHYLRVFQEAGFRVTMERDYAFTEASLATAYTALARWWGRTGMTAYRNALRLRPLAFGLARSFLDCTPLPQSMQFLLHGCD